MDDFSAEHGPEARATIARLRERRGVFQGEGCSVSTGLDGPTACVIAEGGTLVDMLDEGDVDEIDWRRSTGVRRFATVAARDRYLVEQPWQAEVQRRGWAVRDERPGQTSENGAIDLRLYAGMSNSEVTVRAHVEDDRGGARVAIRLRDRAELERRVGLALDEWALSRGTPAARRLALGPVRRQRDGRVDVVLQARVAGGYDARQRLQLLPAGRSR